MSGNETGNPQDGCDCILDVRSKKLVPPPRNVTHPLRYYEFTQEEMKALEECDRESFYGRCLPIGTLFATVTYAAIRTGCLQRNPHFGIYPKVIIAAIMGYITGRASYLPECEQKLREKLPPNSHLKKVMTQYYEEAKPCSKT